MPRRKGPGGSQPGAGRPSLGARTRSVVWTVKLTPAMARDFDAMARRSSTTRAALLLEAIELAIASRSSR